MSDSLAGIDKVHELTIRYLDANYDLKVDTLPIAKARGFLVANDLILSKR
ncbi:hypothetical protein [Clostridioides sp. ZZV14-6153]|nr:hypothetical protein [Clostridioides sp. ZZV14-6153]